MKDQIMTIQSVRTLQPDIYEIVLSGDCTEISKPGQFINITLEGFFLRRPISICDWTDNTVTIIFKAVGAGTDALAKLPVGTELKVLMPLGNGFDIEKAGQSPVLIGGGIGMPPIYGLAKTMVAAGIKPIVIGGFNSASDVILQEEFKALGIEPIITTMDGSVGTKGMVTDVLDCTDDTYLFTCGPEPMLKALWNVVPDGQFSFEARMACGFGACMGCSHKTTTGYKRICKDGPILYKEEIVW